MNTLEAFTIESPFGSTEECAKFVVEDVQELFVLSGIASVGQEYTLTLWVMADAARSLTVANTAIAATTQWKKHTIVFTATAESVVIGFGTVGTYYLYHPQLEFGNKATDWRPAPEDLSVEDDLRDISDRVQTVYESVAELSIQSEGIKAIVGTMESAVNSVTGELEATKSEIASMKLETDELKVGFQTINDNGASKITTETGFTFDRDGMTVDSTDSPTKTQVTPDGMSVYKKGANGEEEEVLEATSEGVDATNLHAKTYLIVGGRSRFENYGSDRTGCFWIGG